MYYNKYIKYKKKYIDLANKVGGSNPEELKKLYRHNRDEYMEIMLENKKSQINEYISSPEKKMLIVGAEPTQYKKFIIPEGFKPIFIEKDFNSSVSNSIKIIERYQTELLKDFPFLLLPIEIVSEKMPGLKFDLIIFDGGVCYWLDIHKPFINYLISLKKDDGVIVFDNKSSSVGESRYFKETKIVTSPQLAPPESIEYTTDINIFPKPFSKRIEAEITRRISEKNNFVDKYNFIRFIKEKRLEGELIKLEFEDKDSSKRKIIIIPNDYPFKPPSLEVYLPDKENLPEETSLPRKVESIIKTIKQQNWDTKYTITDFLEMMHIDDEQKILSLINTNQRNILDVYQSEKLPMIQTVFDSKFNYHIEESTKLSFQIFYNWFKTHYPSKIIQIIDGNDQERINRELATNSNIILISDLNIYNSISYSGTRFFNVYIYIK